MSVPNHVDDLFFCLSKKYFYFKIKHRFREQKHGSVSHSQASGHAGVTRVKNRKELSWLPQSRHKVPRSQTPGPVREQPRLSVWIAGNRTAAETLPSNKRALAPGSATGNGSSWAVLCLSLKNLFIHLFERERVSKLPSALSSPNPTTASLGLRLRLGARMGGRSPITPAAPLPPGHAAGG